MKVKNEFLLTKFKDLKSWEMKLIEMRYDGYPYKDIAEYIKENGGVDYTESWFRQLITSGGKLQEAYKAYCEAMNSESFEEGQKAIKSAHQAAANVVIALLKNDPDVPRAVRLNAAKDILDRNAGKATTKIEVDDNSSEEARAELHKLIEEMRNDKQ